MSENKTGKLWRIYDFFERVVTGGVLGWMLTIPLLMLGGLLHPELGLNGSAGDYAWFGTIPLSAAGWAFLRRDRPGGWISRLLFGAALGLPLGLFSMIILGSSGEAIFGVYAATIFAGIILWPILLHFIHPRPAAAGDASKNE